MDNKNKLIKLLESAIDTEYTTSICFNYIASLIKNGRIKAKFYNFVKEAKENKDLLVKQLDKIGITDFVLEEKCKFCKLKPESFSLIGALNLGLEVTDASIKFFRSLLVPVQTFQDKNLFKKLIKVKTKQKEFLKKEKSFVQQKETEDVITNYCIPEVISKL